MDQALSSKRELWLSCEEEIFLRDCRLELFRSSGKGGQKVNKTSSAARLTHLPSGLSASSQESRSQTENRSKAFRRLRLKIALEVRGESKPPSLEQVPSERNPAYPLFVASLFDALEKCAWDLKASAALLEASPSKLAKTLYRDPELWQAAQRMRAALKLPPFKTP